MPPLDSEIGSAGSAPFIEDLTRQDSETILARNQVGRLAFSFQDRVNVVPVHFVYDQGWIYGRTSPGGKLVHILRNRRVAFEVDEHSSLFDWRSVVVHGTLYRIDRDTSDTEQVYNKAVALLQRLLPATLTGSDPVPFRSQLFRIHAAEITGRSATPTGGSNRQGSVEDPVSELALAEVDVPLRRAAVDAIKTVFGDRPAAPQVDVMEGVIVLSGIVEADAERAAIEREILAIPSARVLVNQIEVDSVDQSRPDPIDLARAVVRELADLADRDGLKVVIENGWLRAEGTAAPVVHSEVLRRLRNVRGARGLVDRTRTRRPI